MAQAAVVGVISAGNLFTTCSDDVRGEIFVALMCLGHALKSGENFANALFDVRRAFSISLGYAEQDFRKSRHALSIFRRKIGAAVKRLAVRRQKHCHRPATAAREQLHRVHINLVQIGTFLTVDLNADEQVIHQGRDLFVLKRLTLHYMAPVTGRVTDTQENRFVLAFCFLKCFVAPGMPIDGIMRVLKQIGAGFVN